jgi:hypothetical protein
VAVSLCNHRRPTQQRLSITFGRRQHQSPTGHHSKHPEPRRRRRAESTHLAGDLTLAEEGDQSEAAAQVLLRVNDSNLLTAG